MSPGRFLLPARRVLVATAAGWVASVLLCSAAGAHVEIVPGEAAAGKPVRLGFVVEHGCADSDTVELQVRFPEGVTEPEPAPVPGWTASVDRRDGILVTWRGGRLPFETEGIFPVEVTIGGSRGETLWFPSAQRCANGEWLRWTEIPTEQMPLEDLTEPAAALVVTASGKEGNSVDLDRAADHAGHGSSGGDGAVPVMLALLVVAAIGLGVALVVQRRRAMAMDHGA